MIYVDLAVLYGVQTKRLNEQVKRNRERFPADFLFQLTASEKAEVVANCDHLQKLKFSKVQQLRQLLDAVRELITPPDQPKRPIGFVTHEDNKDKPKGIGKNIKAVKTKPAAKPSDR